MGLNNNYGAVTTSVGAASSQQFSNFDDRIDGNTLQTARAADDIIAILLQREAEGNAINADSFISDPFVTSSRIETINKFAISSATGTSVNLVGTPSIPWSNGDTIIVADKNGAEVATFQSEAAGVITLASALSGTYGFGLVADGNVSTVGYSDSIDSSLYDKAIVDMTPIEFLSHTLSASTVRAIRYHSEANQIAALREDGEIQMFNATTGAVEGTTAHGEGTSVRSFAILSGSRYGLITNGTNYPIRIFNSNGSEYTTTLRTWGAVNGTPYECYENSGTTFSVVGWDAGGSVHRAAGYNNATDPGSSAPTANWTPGSYGAGGMIWFRGTMAVGTQNSFPLLRYGTGNVYGYIAQPPVGNYPTITVTASAPTAGFKADEIEVSSIVGLEVGDYFGSDNTVSGTPMEHYQILAINGNVLTLDRAWSGLGGVTWKKGVPCKVGSKVYTYDNGTYKYMVFEHKDSGPMIMLSDAAQPNYHVGDILDMTPLSSDPNIELPRGNWPFGNALAVDSKNRAHVVLTDGSKTFIVVVDPAQTPPVLGNSQTTQISGNADDVYISEDASEGVIGLIKRGQTTVRHLTESLSPAAGLYKMKTQIIKTVATSAKLFVSRKVTLSTTLTSAVSSGTQFTVTSSTDFAAGDTIDVWNPDNATWQRFTVASVPDGTHIDVNETITGSFNSGANLERVDVLPQMSIDDGTISWVDPDSYDGSIRRTYREDRYTFSFTPGGQQVNLKLEATTPVSGGAPMIDDIGIALYV